jgi:dGTPase
VVSPTEGILFHTRLTHTLKVAHVGLWIVGRLRSEKRAAVEKVGGIDPDVVEAAALIHDIGHPPFGHAVEQELDKLITDTKVPDGFEGNAQSFRIVTKIAISNNHFPGLNLTRATLNATLKYPWMRETTGYKRLKWGAYGTERAEFNWARELHPRGNDGRGVEAEVMDWADDIAYALHDVEDFYQVGLTPLDRLRTDPKEAERFLNKAVGNLRKEKRYEKQDESDLRMSMKETFNDTVGAIPIFEPYRATRRQRAGLRAYTSSLINDYVNAVGLEPEREPGDQVEISTKARDQVNLLKQLTRIYVVENPSLETQQYGQRRVVRDLFEIYEKAATSKTDLGVFPMGYREEIQVTDDREEQIRIVADAIALMTEQQLLKTHRRLTGLSPGSVMDIII